MVHQSRFCALALLLLQSCSSPDSSDGAPEPEQPAPFPAVESARLTRTLDDVVAAKVAPGTSLALLHPKYQAWFGAAGEADISTKAALSPAARFRAGSMLKVAVATAILQLVERGDLALDDVISELLPADIVARIPDVQQITLRMLLQHTSGLADFSDQAMDLEVAKNPTKIWTFDELLGRALALPRVSEPGARYSYTNTGYILLGRILEQRTGEPWRATLRKQVFARAKLEHSELPEDGNALCNACARGYEAIGDELVDFTEVDPSMSGAAGGDALITTPEDLATFLRALVEGRLFDRASTLEAMLDFAAAEVPEEAQVGYGLGIARFRFGETELIGHYGGTAGFQGFMLYEPSTRVVTSGYMNHRGDFGAFLVPVIEAISQVR